MIAGIPKKIIFFSFLFINLLQSSKSAEFLKINKNSNNLNTKFIWSGTSFGGTLSNSSVISNENITNINLIKKNLNFFLASKPEKQQELIIQSDKQFEITDVINMYLKEKSLKVELLGRGNTWLDTGTYDSLHEASSYIKTIENRQGIKVGCPEEIAWKNKWITEKKLRELSREYIKSGYGDYLLDLIKKEV